MPADADVCDLCGWEVTATVDPAEESFDSVLESPDPSGASSSAPAQSAEQSSGEAAARSAVLVAVGAALLVGGLYLITVVSKSSSSPEAAVVPPTELPIAAPITGEAAAEEAAIRDRISTATGLETIDVRRELVALFVRENRLDLAAEAQEEIARMVDSELEWVRTGNLYYDHMELQGSAVRTAFARKAITAYERALEINPDNLDARTDMALAFFYDPLRPMEAIQNITMVLEADSTHIQANYNRGYLLFQIGRYEAAEAQFEKVKRLIANPDDPIYRRAESAAETVRQRMSTS